MQATQPISTVTAPKATLIAVLALVAALVGGGLAVQLGTIDLVTAPTAGTAADAAGAFSAYRAGERDLTRAGAGLAGQRAGEISFGASVPAVQHGPSGVAPQPGTRGRIAQ
jgi:hypothetical protein